MRRIKSLGAALACVAAALVGQVVAAPVAGADTVTPSTAPVLRFTSYNICGNVCGNPTVYDNQRRIDQVVAEASPTVWGADQIFLSEVCRSQHDAIAARLAPLGYTGLYTATLSGHQGICYGSDYGMSIFVKGPALATTVLDLTQGPEAEPIKNPCIKHKLQGRDTWACSIHLYWSADPTLRDAEARELAAQVKAWEGAGIPVVLGGDFNAPPSTTMASQFYEPAMGGGATGTMIEVDETDADYFTAACRSAGATRCRSGEDSKDGGKIDYVFLSGAHFGNPKADVLPLDTKVSDHKLLRGAAAWRSCGPTSGGLFRRDAAGDLYRHAPTASGAPAAPCKVGNVPALTTRVGTTLAAVDTNGDLWHYPVDATTGTYSSRVKVGSSLQSTNVLIAPGDFSGDGRADLVSRDGNGDLWLHKGTGTAYDPKVKIGFGWQIYTVLLAPGDFTGDGKADLIGRDAAGDLWLYHGNGSGSYAPRVKIGYGWNFFTALAAPGDFNGDGKADLIGRSGAGALYFYAGNGAGGYAAGVAVASGYAAGETLF